MIMFRTYKYLLRPSSKQDRQMDYLLWQARLIYNAALEQKINAYQETGKSPGVYEQGAFFRSIRHANPDTVGMLNGGCLNNILRRLDKAYAAFFRRIKAGQTPGFPKFKNRSEFRSMDFNYGNGCKLRFKQQGRAGLYIQNIGIVRICYYRPVPEDGVIKQATIKNKNGRWYVFFKAELPEPQPVNKPAGAIGIDAGLKSMLAFSDGTLIENQHGLKHSLAELRVKQRRACRRQTGSRRQAMAYRQVALLYEYIANSRRDYLHKITSRLVTQYGLIAIEDLSTEFMHQDKHTATLAMDASLANFRRLLEYKASAAGVQVIAVSPYNTSQRCSQCGELVPKDLDTRIHSCPHCGLVLDRDVNAARNILQAALAQVNTQ
jgi:putative transposase